MTPSTHSARYRGLHARVLVSFVATAPIALTLFGCGSSSHGSGASPAQTGLLSVQVATSGTLHQRLGGSTLTLHGIYPSVTGFSDRPERTVVQIPDRAFAHLWQQPTFRRDPPNAALAISGAPASADVFVLELRDPQLRGRSISYRARPEPDSGIKNMDDRRDPVQNAPTSFHNASLLIDDIPWNPGGF